MGHLKVLNDTKLASRDHLFPNQGVFKVHGKSRLLAGSSKIAPRILIFRLPRVPTFLLAEIHCYLSALKSWHNNSLLSNVTWRPLVAPYFRNHLKLKNTDGLMAFFISDYKPNMTNVQKQLLFDGKRNGRVLLICHKNKWCDLWLTLITSSFSSFSWQENILIQPIRMFFVLPQNKWQVFVTNLMKCRSWTLLS